MAEKLYAVLTPVKNFKGRRFGVVFTDGKGMATKREATVLVNNWKYTCPELEASVQLTVISNQLPDSTDSTGGALKEDAKPPAANAPKPPAGNAPKADGKQDGKPNK